MFKAIKALLLSLFITTFIFADVLMTELTDPQNSSDAGRYVELYNNGSSAVDFSTGWALQRWTNGNADPQSAKELEGTIAAGGFYIICNNADKFAVTYGLTCDQDIGTGGPADSNGDDNIALLDDSGAIVDMFGVAGEDGSGTGHEFEDGRAERAAGVTAANPTWVAAEWNIDNDSGGGDGNQYAPEGFDPFVWIGADSGGGGDTCEDETACNTGAEAACEYPETGFDCDGNCIEEVDCAGVCGGDAVEDCSGECGGDAVVDDCGECGGSNACMVTVTFYVDMAFEDVSDDGVAVYGLISWWEGTAMSDEDGDGVFSVSIGLTPGDHLYKFKNGSSWEDVDELDCAVFDDEDGDGFGYWDRTVTVTDTEIVLDTDCFSACGECVGGCTDPNASNYDENANTDDGSCNYDVGDPENLFFSEYAEGSSNNKYLEIYNAEDSDVDLSGYSLSSCSNGCNDGVSWDYPDNVTFDAGTSVAAGDVFVVCHGSADSLILAECDQTFTYLSNGDDVFALTQIGSGAILDIIGTIGDDPGSGWDAAGVTNATKDHTLVRKSSVTSGNGGDWAASAGTDADDSEWEVYDQNTWDYLGSHTAGGDESCTMGDVNNDGAVNVLDVVQIVNYIIDPDDQIDPVCADYNGDGAVNVLDIVGIVNTILAPRSVNDATSAVLIQNGNQTMLNADGYIGGVQMRLIHPENDKIELDLTGLALVADYQSRDGQTVLVIVEPNDRVLFTSNAEFDIAEVIVANSYKEVEVNIPTEFGITKAFPNPFNPVTTIELTVDEGAEVSVKVYNLTGQLVTTLADSYMAANTYQFTWNAENAPSGMYLIKAGKGGSTAIQKIMLLK